ncbi:PucR family transcriptional regulator [Phytoactinopolyspora halotolerans]|uniref:PucR family transcriptional regulator n=1 Tax=Phytoactinopolyspora halotolerans TaxID=1981512 RepID=A0A6L9S5C9_9ACTN|nr:PucR family transcriptional regulator [Phytoactinopolyspora halotolerans]
MHISELPDPTIYLDGGELLLTTGLALPAHTQGCREYVERLVRGGVAALAFGVGPVHRTLPPRLVDACRDTGLCLLHVPEPTPFLTITRAFWAAVTSEDRRELSAALDSHRRLVGAALGADPIPEVLRTLARAVSGWAAQLDPNGELRAVWPVARENDVRTLRSEAMRLRMSGVRAAATFPLGDEDVVVHPLAVGERVVGYLATGAPSPMSAMDRHVVLAACALLSLDSVRGRRRSEGVMASRAAVAQLLDLGEIAAARQLAARFRITVPDGPVRVVVVDGIDGDAALDAVAAAWPAQDVLGVAGDVTWCVIADDGRPVDLEALRASLTMSGDGARALVGPPVPVQQLSSQRCRLVVDLRRQPETSVGEVAVGAGSGMVAGDDGAAAGMAASRAQAILGPLLSRDRSDVVDAVAAYLRHQGQWEAAARELGVHRNTLRYRIGRAETLLGRDLRDPDVAATTWLALRGLGLA